MLGGRVPGAPAAGTQFRSASLWAKRQLTNPNGLLLRLWPARAGERIELVASLLFVSVGIFLRSRHFFVDPIPLFGDETNWALRLDEDLSRATLRPVGFMALSKLMAHWFGFTEVALRFFPWLFGVGSSVLALPLGQRLFRAPAARLLLVAVVAFHPFCIDYCKEFKPYSISLFIHFFCLFAAASYLKLGSARWLAVTLAASAFGILFAQDVLFAYPGLYLALALTAFQRRARRHGIVVALSGLATLALVFSLYWFFWRHLDVGSDATQQYWGGRYHVFFAPGAESRWHWLVGKTADVIAFPGVRRWFWATRGPFQSAELETLGKMDLLVWVALYAIGVLALAFQRRAAEALLLLTPLLTTLIFNQLGLWPFGVFRTNLFLLAYTLPVAALALDAPGAPVASWRAFVPVTLLVLAPLVAFEKNWHAQKIASSPSVFFEALNALVELQGHDLPEQRELLVIDGSACRVWLFYKQHHADHEQLFSELERRFADRCAPSRGETAFKRAHRGVRGHPRRFWLLLQRAGEQAAFRGDQAPAGYRVFAKKELGSGLNLVVGLDPIDKRPRRSR